MHPFRALTGAVARGCLCSAFRLLSVLCSEALAALPTSLGEDERILESLDGNCVPRLRLAVAWRIGYKRALQRGVHCSLAALSALGAEL